MNVCYDDDVCTEMMIGAKSENTKTIRNNRYGCPMLSRLCDVVCVVLCCCLKCVVTSNV